MTDNDPSVQTDVRLTRRSVVRTGVRLAYASPLIAASFKLAPLQARAESDDVVSGIGKPAPPRISSVQSKEPGTVDIAGQRLAGATVRVTVDDGTKDGKVVTRSWPDGTVVVNTDQRIRMTLDEGTVVIQVLVITPNGEAKSKRKRVRVKSEKKQSTVDEQRTEANKTTEQEPSSNDDQSVEDQPKDDEPTEERAARRRTQSRLKSQNRPRNPSRPKSRNRPRSQNRPRSPSRPQSRNRPKNPSLLIPSSG